MAPADSKATIGGLLILVAAVMAPACRAGEQAISLSEVPPEVIEAARRSVPGIELSEAEVSRTESGLRYEVEGDANGRSYELQIEADGTVIDIEEDD